MISHSCYHLVEDDKVLCSKCKRILTHFTERVNEVDFDSDDSDSDSDSDELVSSLYSSGAVVGLFTVLSFLAIQWS